MIKKISQIKKKIIKEENREKKKGMSKNYLNLKKKIEI